jgi:predicted RNase H-like nuclease (RuvC/YqgF family)
MQQKKNHEPLFTKSYAAYLKQLKNHSQDVLGKKLTPHALRHSSATLYAKILAGDMIQLADRYGWNYDAAELKTYVRRSGASQREAVKKSFSNDLLELKEENRELKEKLQNHEDVIEQMNNTLDQLSNKMAQVTESIKQNAS